MVFRGLVGALPRIRTWAPGSCSASLACLPLSRRWHEYLRSQVNGGS